MGIGILFLLILIGAVHFVARKIGCKKFCKKVFYVFSCHWICRLIILLRTNNTSLDDDVNGIVFNDPEIVE